MFTKTLDSTQFLHIKLNTVQAFIRAVHSFHMLNSMQHKQLSDFYKSNCIED